MKTTYTPEELAQIVDELAQVRAQIADLMHYADRKGYNFEDALKAARCHHQTEKATT